MNLTAFLILLFIVLTIIFTFIAKKLHQDFDIFTDVAIGAFLAGMIAIGSMLFFQHGNDTIIDKYYVTEVSEKSNKKVEITYIDTSNKEQTLNLKTEDIQYSKYDIDGKEEEISYLERIKTTYGPFEEYGWKLIVKYN